MHSTNEVFGKIRKQQYHIQYQEQLTIDTSLKNINAASKEAAKVLYSLAGVVVHEGKTIQGGHYVSYVKKFGQWYHTDDVRVTKVSPFEATHQQAYLLFYQKVQNCSVLSPLFLGLVTSFSRHIWACHFLCNGATLAHSFLPYSIIKLQNSTSSRLLLSTVMLLMKDLVSVARPEGSDQ